jgi:hypothetical protein
VTGSAAGVGEDLGPGTVGGASGTVAAAAGGEGEEREGEERASHRVTG